MLALLRSKSVLTNFFCITIITNQKPITLEQMLHHCQAVKRGAPNRPLLVGDMPFGSYEFEDIDIALRNAYRMVKEAGMDAVKFEVCVICFVFYICSLLLYAKEMN